MWDDPLSQAVELRAKSEPFVFATVVACRRPTSAYPGAKAIIRRDGTFSGWVGGSCAQPIVVREALKAMEDGSPRLLRIGVDQPSGDQAQEGVLNFDMPCQSQGALEIYMEPFLPRPELLIFGETPLAQALARAGRLIDFSICVSDPAATSEAFPDADVLLAAWSRCQLAWTPTATSSWPRRASTTRRPWPRLSRARPLTSAWWRARSGPRRSFNIAAIMGLGLKSSNMYDAPQG